MREHLPSLRRNPGPRTGLSAVTTIVLVVLLGGLAAAGYVCLFPSSRDQFPFACNLPAPPPSGPKTGASCPTAVRDFPVESSVALPNGGQEIMDFTGEGDTLFSLFSASLPDEDSAREVTLSLASVVQKALTKPFDGLTPLEPDKSYTITLDAEGRFLQATIELDPSKVFHAALRDGAIHSWQEDVVLDFKVESICFPMKGSLLDSVLAAGEGTELATKLGNVFKWDIDFRSESRRGDVCKVMVERKYADDRRSGYGEILCAVYEGKQTGKKTALLFNRDYFSEKGEELRKPFLRSPLLGEIRVTSKFGGRFHPIRREWHKHKGVDLGAPQGTPVYSVAGGVVTQAGWHDEYGNYVFIKHDGGFESRYGHLQKCFVQQGRRVAQHTRIGLVGTTGNSTGPHLHYEWLKNGVHTKPVTEPAAISIKTVHTLLKPRFKTVAQERLQCLGALAGSEPDLGKKHAGLR